jgi:LysM repeat protein
VFVIISTIVVALVLLLASGAGAGSEAIGATDAYVVHAGDTLWEIAAERTADGRDVRDTVATIRAINRLTDSVIQPGQILEVPVVETAPAR